MLHARIDGETFGLSPGKFAINYKPVVTCANTYGQSHINILGDKAVLYNNFESLYEILNTFKKGKYNMENNGYLKYSPQNVMKIFKKVFLDI